MNHRTRTNILAGMMAGAIILFFPVAALADDNGQKAQAGEQIDAYEAVALANRDNCWRCHHLTKKKEGPSYKAVAEKYRGKPEAIDKLVKHITLGKDVIKLSDGHEELHKFDKKRPPEEIRNLILYILAQ
ncbi:MAG: hypothetical protein A3F73_14335 [Gallionellales bacterium RIFCSPLOWO2_12_FULL_59_22]|nr:MAG: hypothetical protein A3H99_06980 [Gallionellales bacterium RIFCSPLOWO2_02_FULL_59_110]OGT05607.1 MAG: hypothetical protein A2Z65_04190 [Gallionellales bacterium RIFCSPLOWO2_02_58_13]OGT14759.1 MAG: hypothetical protein A3F73_14335 [Gallionellales bacterium RIFCSPLOWO2_12_FULL_59_22]